MDCPVCGAKNAEQISTTIGGAVLATEQLQRLELDERRDALNRAKRSAPPGTRPMMTNLAALAIALVIAWWWRSAGFGWLVTIAIGIVGYIFWGIMIAAAMAFTAAGPSAPK